MMNSLLERAKQLRDTIEPFGWLSRTGSPSAYAECIAPLLMALKWDGEVHQLCESLPHYPDRIGRIDVINTLSNLNYSIRQARIHPASLDRRIAPCLLVVDQDRETERPYVVFADGDGGILAFDAREDRVLSLAEVAPGMATLYKFTPLTEESLQKNRISDQVDAQPLRWFQRIFLRFVPVGGQVLVLSLAINFLALVSSLYVMAVYDKVIGSRSQETLLYLGAGTVLAILFESVLRFLRARSLAFFGVRLDALITAAIFERLLFLPPRIVENSSIPAQLSRLKDFDSVRSFFAGSLAITLHEIPFTAVFILAIWAIGGPLVQIPLLLILLYALLGLVMLPRIQSCTEDGAVAAVKKQTLMVETMRKFRVIRLHGVHTEWLRRYRELSGISAYTSFKSSQQTAIIESLAYGLSVAAGVSTITYGIFLVWEGAITTGALIASMMLVWRVISPLQALCNSLVRIRYVFRSVGQVHKLMRSEPETTPLMIDQELRIKGDIVLAGVGLRYASERAAVFSNVSLEMPHGQAIAVSGRSGSGKSSFLKLIMGLYPTQMGAVRIDGMDIRQRDPVSLRRNIAYVPQQPELFHGSIEQNLRMCRPDATPEEIDEALRQSGALAEIERLKDGIRTFIGDYRSEQLPSTLVYQLTLSRAYLRDSAIMLFDEMPPTLIGKETGRLFREYLLRTRTAKTLVFVSDREEEILLADQLVYLTGTGQVFAGRPEELLLALKKEK